MRYIYRDIYIDREIYRERARETCIVLLLLLLLLQYNSKDLGFTFFLSMKKSHVYHSCSYLIKSTVKTKM